MAKPTPIDFAPGVVKTDAPHTLRGRYIDSDKVRFVKGKPQKWAGWSKLWSGLVGIARAITNWEDNQGSKWVAVGTHKKLYMISSSNAVNNITPVRLSGTLALNPITTISGLANVTISHVSHGLIAGTSVTYSGATAVGGINIAGTYVVMSVIDANTYTITAASAASSSATGGGAAVAFSYEINGGDADVTQGAGYGLGTYGTGTYGTPRVNSSYLKYARIWSLDNYGQNLLAMPSGDYLYQWDPTTPSNVAAKVANSPTGNFMFITNERYPVILGAGGDLLTLSWPDQNDITNWTPGALVTGNTRKVQKGSRLVAGANLNGTANILWTDDAVYAMNYTGARNIIYTTLVAGERCGLIGPHAFIVARGIAYWLGHFDFFMYGGSIQGIPNSQDMRDWVYARLDGKQNWKCVAHYSAENNEVKWNYVLAGAYEPAFYVAVSLDDYSWTNGTENRTAWKQRGGIAAKTYGTDELGNVYQHETGLNADGLAMSWLLEAAPINIDEGRELVDIQGYIPNFFTQVGDVQLTISTRDLPQNVALLETSASTIVEGAAIVDLHLSGRQVSIRLDGFALNGNFRLGVADLEIASSGKRRGGP